MQENRKNWPESTQLPEGFVDVGRRRRVGGLCTGCTRR